MAKQTNYGTAWVVNDTGEIYQWNNGDFQVVPGGNAMDISANADGQVWIVGRAQGATRPFRSQRDDRREP